MILKKISRLLTNKQRIAFLVLIVVLTVSAFLELIGIYLISWIVDTFDKKLAWTAMFFYIGKNMFQLILCRVQYTYIYKCQLGLSKQLISGYLNKPYIFHTQTNSAEILRNIIIDSERFYQLVLYILMLFSEVMIAVFLGLFLLLTDTITTILVVMAFVVLVLVYFFVVKNKMNKFGVLNHESDANMHKAIKEALGAVKDVKITHREDFFVNRFVNNGKIKTNAQINENIMNLMPQYIFELVCVGIVLSIVIFKLYMGESVTSMLPELTAFAIAVFKLLPSVTKVNNYINKIVFLRPSADLVYDDLCDMKNDQIMEDNSADTDYDNRLDSASTECYANNGDNAKPESILSDDSAFLSSYGEEYISSVAFDNVSYKYPETDKYILNNVTLEIVLGQSIGLIGPTGAGKSTFADILLGILMPTDGRVMYGNMNVHENGSAWSDKLSYIPQAIFLSDDSIKRNIAFGIKDDEIDENKVKKAVREAQLEEFVASLPDGLDTEVGEMGARISGGQRQRIGIARALYNDPEIIVLDEATSALDNDTESAIMDAINRLHGKKTLVIIAHRLSTIEGCDAVYKVDNGMIEKVK